MNKSSSGGFSICAVLLIAFIILKLCGVIKWSWLWVLSPLWISVILWILVFGIAVYWFKK